MLENTNKCTLENISNKITACIRVFFVLCNVQKQWAPWISLGATKLEPHPQTLDV